MNSHSREGEVISSRRLAVNIPDVKFMIGHHRQIERNWSIKSVE
jgi:hypothetical protein